MLSGVQLNEVVKDVKIFRMKRGLERKDLALEAQVGVRFVRNVEEERRLKWRLPLVQKLLRVLVALDLKLHEEAIKKKVSQVAHSPRKKRRCRFDRRRGGVVLNRRCRR